MRREYLAGILLLLLPAFGCAVFSAERAGSLSNQTYEPGGALENRIVALLGAGLLLSDSPLAPGLADPEARLLRTAESLIISVRGLDKTTPAGSILKTAFSQVGLPYKFGGTSPQTGFDCSGFVGWVYGQNGFKLPRSSPEMLGVGQGVARQSLVPGDLVFFGRKNRVTHVGIYTGNNRYIHSPTRGRVIQESSLDDRSRGEYYVGARRLLSGLGPAPAAGENTVAMAAVTQASPAPAAKPAKKTPSKTHKVKTGDTLYGLARKYGLSLAELAQANKLNQKQQASLRLGQVLTVPVKTAKK
jgi:LysM repeat protein